MTTLDESKPAEVACLDHLLDQYEPKIREIVNNTLYAYATKPGNIVNFWQPANQRCRELKEDDALADMIDNLLDAIRENESTRQWVLTHKTGS